MNTPQSQPFSALEEIKRLETKIAELRGEQLRELKQRRKVVLAELESIDSEIAKITEIHTVPFAVNSRNKSQRRRINDEDLKGIIVKALVEHGVMGLSIPEISEHIGHDAQRIRKFISSNPRALKQQGAGRGTRYFLP